MHKILLLTTVFIINYTFSQNTVGTTEISDGVYDGFTLFTATTETYLLNNCGEVINQWSSNFPPGNAVYLRDNGSLLRTGRTESTDITFGGQGGVVEIYDWDGNLTWQYFYDTPLARQHHDVYPMPNGNILILAATRITNTDAVQLGRNPALLPQTDLYNEQIIEVTPIGENNATIVWEWNIKDHLVQDFDNTKDNFGDISLNPGKLNVNFLNGGSGGSNWLHFNSIQFNPVLDQIIISCRNLSEIYIIDHSTTTSEAATDSGGLYGKGGDILYRWGNPQAYNQGTESERKLYGQHYAHVINVGLSDENKIMLFNNGNGRTPQYSEVFILSPETDNPGVYTYEVGSAYGPTEPEYIYGSPDSSSSYFSRILSSAQRLPNGNTLICEGINGRFFEINDAEEVVWEYINPVNTANGNIATQGDNPSTYPNVSFRALKYNSNYAAFNGKDLTPSDPIEVNPDLTACHNLNVLGFEMLQFNLYPNPTKGHLTIDSKVPISKIEIFNVLGERIASTTFNVIDLSEHEIGIYFLKIYTNSEIISQKVVKN